MGVNPVMLFTIMFIDGTYGAFIHVGENLVKDARFGFLNKIMLTPLITGFTMPETHFILTLIIATF